MITKKTVDKRKAALAAKRLKLGSLLTSLSVEKAEVEDTLFSRSISDEDPFVGLYGSNRLIQPPYSFSKLYNIFEESDILQPCVDAMVQNVDGFGYQMLFSGDDVEQRESSEAQRELQFCEDFFDHVNERQSFIALRKEMRQDYEVLGNGALEVVRNLRGEIAMLYHLPFKSIRLTEVGSRPVKVEVSIRRGGRDQQVQLLKYFRKYAQVTAAGKVRWFKEYGDPRTLDALTGKYIPKGKKATVVASEVWHIKQNIGGEAYGLPRWIGSILKVVGMRSADFVNYDLFENQGIPPMAVMLSGGVLSEPSMRELEALVKSARGLERFNRILILEALPEGLGLEDKGTAKIELKNLTEYRKEDQMFGKYSESAEKAIRHSFRIPPLYVGAASSFTHACHDSITETLTEHGWRFYWEIGEFEKIATIVPETGKLEYHIPEEFHLYDFDEEMISFQTRGVDSVVTPNHDMWLSYPTHKVPNLWQKVKAEQLLKERASRYKFQVASLGFDGGYRPEDDSIPTMDFELFLEWMAYLVADGHAAEVGSRISFNVKKDRKKKRYGQVFKEIANVYGGRYTRRVEKREGYVSFELSKNQDLHNWCRKNLYAEDKSKCLPDWALHLDIEDSKLLLESLIFGDGCAVGRGPNSQVYVTTSKFLADQVQIIAFRVGFRTRITNVVDSRENRKVVYYVHMTRTSSQEVLKRQIARVPYKGKVYCFNVKNHLFVTRRNGKIAIHGNTAKAAQTVAEEQIFIPQRQSFDELVNTFILHQEFGISLWLYRSKGPRLVSGSDMAGNVKSFVDIGAMSINHAVERANEAFGLAMSKFSYKWADFPVPFILEAIKAGAQLEGMDDFITEWKEAVTSSGTPVEGDVLPGQEGKVIPLPQAAAAAIKSDLFSQGEKEMYGKLLELQKVIEGNVSDD